MTTSLPRIAAVLLAVALVSFAQRPAGTHAEGSADNVQPIDLAMMVLPLSAFGPDYGALQPGIDIGFDGADNVPGELDGYSLQFINPSDDFIGLPAVFSTVQLYPSAADASQFVPHFLDEAQNNPGYQVAEFPVTGLTGATGFLITGTMDEFGFNFVETGVILQQDRLIGGVAIIRTEEIDIHTTVNDAAVALNERIKGVLTGRIRDFATPLPPDVNCNGSLDSIDASLVLQLGAGLVDSLPCDALADANQDGRTNAIDASLILQYSAGLIDSLPV